MNYADIRYLSVPLPEDILHAREHGDFALAISLIDRRIGSGRLPDAMVKRLTLEKEILRRTADEYPLTEEEALAELREGLGPVSEDTFRQWILDHDLDWMYVDGVRHIKDDAISNLYKTHDDLAAIAYSRGKRKSDGKPSALLDAVIAEMQEKGEVYAHYRVRADFAIRTGAPGRPVRVWLPIPCEYAQVRDVVIAEVSHPETAAISAPQASQRTVCMDGMDDEAFFVEYEYKVQMRYMQPDPARVTVDQPTFYTQEQPPHIRFTPFLRALCAEIVGQETNPLLKARRIYDYIVHHVRYAYMRNYLNIPMIPEYAAANLRGDCGVQALLFITLCRIAGIPARWQSGLYLEPGDIGCHDWAQFYVAPFGWMFADCSFGGSAVRRGMKRREDFYFCNIDPFRMPANSAFQQDFEVPPRWIRHDPYDNQLGEAEYAEGPVPRSACALHHRLLEVSGLESCRERPEFV